ncbi:MAG: hypothetical protein JO234_03455 [Hyphomicrobiales bacterium]|nr:hypothetical protein [Hyphomicrobiales bacterium]
MKSALVATIAAGAVLCVSAIANAAMTPPTAVKTSVTKVQWYANKCSPGFHGINAPNGNGYRCVPDDQ